MYIHIVKFKDIDVHISMDMQGTRTLHRCRVYAGKPKLAQARVPPKRKQVKKPNRDLAR